MPYTYSEIPSSRDPKTFRAPPLFVLACCMLTATAQKKKGFENLEIWK